MRPRSICMCVLTTLILITVSYAGKPKTISKPLERDHPFLIVRTADYAELRARASRSPWRELKSKAVAYASVPIYSRHLLLSDAVSAAALSYILDNENATRYRNIITSAIRYLTELKFGSSEHDPNVDGGTVLFNCLLALDIIYNDLSPDERTQLETIIGERVALILDTAWPSNGFGIKGLWALYRGDRSELERCKEGYRRDVLSFTSRDGVIALGPGYSWSRYSGNRDAKAYFMDVLEYNGEDRYYTDPRMQKAYEWLYGYSVSPFRLVYTFGDSPWDKQAYNGAYAGHPAAYRAYRFSQQAAEYAAWANRGIPPRPYLLTYVLMGREMPPAKRPTSRIFPDGGAWFLEDSSAETALAGALWNKTNMAAHSHYDVNAVHLCAFGENVLQNSGYAGYKENALGFSWDYIANSAKSSNTVMARGMNHSQMVGAGIAEGFTASTFDYACGDSGRALGSRHHSRNFIFVHPIEGKNGYWVLIDEVSGMNVRDAMVALHPSSAEYTVVDPDREYRWTVRRLRKEDTYLTVFLGTAPNKVEVKDGVLAAYDQSFVGKYLYSTYEAGKSGKSIVTVLFPHDGQHGKARITRIEGQGYTGVEIENGGGLKDIIWESYSAAAPVTHNGYTAEGLASFFRRNGRQTVSYFVRQGRSFDDGNSTGPQGFTSGTKISLYMNGTRGWIISPGTEVSFRYTGITGILIDGVNVPLLETGPGNIKVAVPAGTHQVELVTR